MSFKINIAIFASGAGSNAQKLINYFRDSDRASIGLIVCNNPEAGVLHIAQKEAIPARLITPADLKAPDDLLRELRERQIGFIVLAGFLKKIPPALVQAFPKAIVNIHPALLPAYGGKGMYGRHVHEAVIRNGETKSGISIHWVDEQYDHGQLIFQATCSVKPDDTAEELAARIHQLEHEHYPRIIASVLPNPR